MYYVPCNTLQMVISAQGPNRDSGRNGTQEVGPQHGKKQKTRKVKRFKRCWGVFGPAKVRENDLI